MTLRNLKGHGRRSVNGKRGPSTQRGQQLTTSKAASISNLSTPCSQGFAPNCWMSIALVCTYRVSKPLLLTMDRCEKSCSAWRRHAPSALRQTSRTATSLLNPHISLTDQRPKRVIAWVSRVDPENAMILPPLDHCLA